VKQEYDIIRIHGEEKKNVADQVAVEAPITIFLNGREVVTFLCTPQFLADLAVGFLIGEGLIKDTADIIRIGVKKDQGLVEVEAKKENMIAGKTFGKRYLTSGCGKGTSFYGLMDSRQVHPITVKNQFKLEQIRRGIRVLQTDTALFKDTGGVHACALMGEDGLLVLREDIGRHNAADKVLGWLYHQKLDIEKVFFITTGRISSEILLKVAKTGISLLVSRSAPTSLAVEISREINMSMIGFMRGTRANIYVGEERVIL